MYESFAENIKERGLKVHGVKIFENGEEVLSQHFDEDKRYPIYSAVKTLTSAAVGLAVNDGKLKIENPISDYIDAGFSDKVKQEAFSKLSVERFLTMSVTGFPFRPSGGDWLQFSLSQSSGFDKSAEFSYSNISAYLVGVACENAVGMPLGDYINERLLKPLEIDYVEFAKDPQGRFYGATGASLTLDEFAKIGLVYLNGGSFDGKEIIQSEWVKLSSRTHIKNSDGGYGYFIWTGKDSFSISGKWGQKCLICPKKKMLIAYLSDEANRSGELFSLANELILAE